MSPEPKIVVSVETLREMARQLSTMLKYVKSLKDESNARIGDNKNWTVSNNFDLAFRPQDFYCLQFGKKVIRILLMRNKRYTLECVGFSPKDYDFFDKDKAIQGDFIDFYRNLYGCWFDFGEAKNAFSDVCRQMTEFDTRPLF